uniref:Uncharacterized protein n=1 Tax=Arundo donax TaxID=35708 RepID=A0A0A9BQC5_ARUDO
MTFKNVFTQLKLISGLLTWMLCK